MNFWCSAVTAVIALVVTAGLGFILIPMLRRLKYGQTILDIGPAWHKEKKQGKPTMGGIMFIIGTVAAFTIGIIMLWQNGFISFEAGSGTNLFKAVSGIIMAVCFGFVGFLDDFISIKKKRNEGLSPNQKMVFQIMIIAAYFTARIISGDTATTITFPFLGTVDFWYFYYVIMGLAILYLVNAVNLTDGIDGLCSSVTVIYCAVFIIICNMFAFYELSILAIATGGALIGFLIWNFHPAKIFMGDTGSLFLGGIVCAVGIGARCEVIMVVACAVYIWEALTVLIQMTYFKITRGKRLFKMTPIHHSFELRGFKEVRIVLIFCSIAVLAGILSLLLAQGV